MPKSYTHSNNRVFVRVFPQSKSPLLTQNYESGEFSTVSTPPTTITILIYINNNALAKGIVMKIYCNKSELYRALNNAIQAVPSRSTSKILEGEYHRQTSVRRCDDGIRFRKKSSIDSERTLPVGSHLLRFRRVSESSDEGTAEEHHTE